MYLICKQNSRRSNQGKVNKENKYIRSAGQTHHLSLGKHYIRLQLHFLKQWGTGRRALQQSPHCCASSGWAEQGGCSSPPRAFPPFLSQPAPLAPHACRLGAGFGLAFLLPGLLCSNRCQTVAAAVAEVSGHCAHMTRLRITTVRGRRKRKRLEINNLLYQERTNYSANLLLLILSHNLIH